MPPQDQPPLARGPFVLGIRPVRAGHPPGQLRHRGRPGGQSRDRIATPKASHSGFVHTAALDTQIPVPFDGGSLFDKAGSKPLPGFAADIDCANWAQFFLKWVIAHPAVTCAIPATRFPAHLDQNMGARLGRMPAATMQQRMQAHVRAI